MRPDMEFNEKDHRYFVGGRILPSVSEVLEVLGSPYEGVPKFVLEHKAKVGKALHKIFEGTWRVPIDMSEKDKRKAQALAGWVADNQPEFIERETKTCSLEHGYAGTFDALVLCRAGEYKGKKIRIDVKSSSKLFPDRYFPQLEAYEQCEKEHGEQVSDLRAILWLPVDSRAIIVESTDTFDDFKCILDVFYSQRERKKKLSATRGLRTN